VQRDYTVRHIHSQVHRWRPWPRVQQSCRSTRVLRSLRVQSEGLGLARSAWTI